MYEQNSVVCDIFPKNKLFVQYILTVILCHGLDFLFLAKQEEGVSIVYGVIPYRIDIPCNTQYPFLTGVAQL